MNSRRRQITKNKTTITFVIKAFKISVTEGDTDVSEKPITPIIKITLKMDIATFSKGQYSPTTASLTVMPAAMATSNLT